MRLKAGGMVTIFGHSLMKEIEQSDLLGIDGRRIIRVERHEFSLVVEPVSKISMYRIWTENVVDPI